MNPPTNATKIGLLHGQSRPASAALLRRVGGTLVRIYDGNPATAMEMVLRDAHAGAIDILIIDGLNSLAPKPFEALRIVLLLRELKVAVLSAAEDWLPHSLDGLQPALRWLDEQERRARLKAVQRGVARARAEGRLPGRPRASVPARALELVAGGMPVGQAARLLGVAEGTLRRRVAELRADQFRVPSEPLSAEVA